LTHNWRSAKVKLIPKKGDLSNLKNWRPISLLSNFYKILSRAINIRLNKFVNRICSRAQKGYNSQRYAQEVLINVWEQINYCRTNGIKGAIVAIDMAKAFDTLSHSFLEKVYKFYNFGPEIIKWLSLLGNEREACIILDNGCKSRYFKLG
jgi:Reverse transcriptase (RNA-dependent DNA polymerase)